MVRRRQRCDHQETKAKASGIYFWVNRCAISIGALESISELDRNRRRAQLPERLSDRNMARFDIESITAFGRANDELRVA
jgi:hypothetical protein